MEPVKATTPIVWTIPPLTVYDVHSSLKDGWANIATSQSSTPAVHLNITADFQRYILKPLESPTVALKSKLEITRLPTMGGYRPAYRDIYNELDSPKLFSTDEFLAIACHTISLQRQGQVGMLSITKDTAVRHNLFAVRCPKDFRIRFVDISYDPRQTFLFTLDCINLDAEPVNAEYKKIIVFVPTAETKTP
jgi:hypothetical protein